MLNITALSKRYPNAARPVFSGLGFSVAAGEIVALIGESGVGKSTLLNCIAGLEAIDGGTIRVGDTPIERLDDDAMARLRRSHFGFVFQAFHILPHLDLLQNVALPLWLLGTAEADAARRAREMLARVGLGARATDPPQQLSGGELQRVAIARALVHRPHLVLADEPTGNLDPGRASEVLDLLLGQIRDSRAAGVMVTHSRSAAARADRVLELRADGLHDITERT